ncbi:Uncharacterised protein [Burkholderia pseudomallei]|nr:Uncharacterised protein [Burkholderia pseudomallei]
MYVIRFENGQTEHAFEDELSSSDVVKREYLFHIEGLGRDVWQIGETEKAAYSAVWTALNDAERNRVVQIECIDERKPTASQSSETDVLAGTARRARNYAVRPHQVIPAAASTGEVLVRLPGVWDDVGDGCYVKRYQNGSDFLEASVLSDGVLRLQAKVVGGVGDVVNAVQCVLEKRIDLRDTTAIPTAIEALEDALARSIGVPARDSRDDQLGQPEENVRPVVARFRADGNFNEAAANLRRVIEQQSAVLRAELMGAFSGLLEAAEAVRDQYQSDWRAAKAIAERVKLPSAAAPTLSSNSYLKESIRRLQNGLDCYTADAPEHAEISAALSALNGLQSGQVPIAGGLPEAAESTMRLPDSFVGDERVVRNLASFVLMMARDARGDESWILAARGAIGTLRANRPDLVSEGERFAWHRDESPSPDL